jgi:acyl dehydratase
VRYFEDFPEGLEVDLGEVTFTQEDIITFARQFDPLPMHTDPSAAAKSIYGGLIASGWHTVGAYMRLLVDSLVGESASVGSPGIDNLRWLKPVRPGDTLRGRFSVTEARPSNSRPDWGIVRSRGEMTNQHGDVVLRLEAANFFTRREN